MLHQGDEYAAHLVVEYSPKVVAVREHVRLARQVGAACSGPSSSAVHAVRLL